MAGAEFLVFGGAHLKLRFDTVSWVHVSLSGRMLFQEGLTFGEDKVVH